MSRLFVLTVGLTLGAPGAAAEKVPLCLHILSRTESCGELFESQSRVRREFAASAGWVRTQVRWLNRIYDPLVQFNLRQVRYLEGPDGDRLFEASPEEIRAAGIEAKYGDRSCINIFVSAGTHGLFGFANGIFVPLGGSEVPSIAMRNGIHTVLGVLVAHEVGHLLGLEHTATPDPALVHQREVGAQTLQYPQFHFDNFFSLSTPAPVGDSQYPAWRGMVNIMALPNLQNYLTLRLPTILEGPYGPTFQKIIDSWFSAPPSPRPGIVAGARK